MRGTNYFYEYIEFQQPKINREVLPFHERLLINYIPCTNERLNIKERKALFIHKTMIKDITETAKKMYKPGNGMFIHPNYCICDICRYTQPVSYIDNYKRRNDDCEARYRSQQKKIIYSANQMGTATVEDAKKRREKLSNQSNTESSEESNKGTGFSDLPVIKNVSSVVGKWKGRFTRKISELVETK